MRIFISVAGPDRPKVEAVALALRGEGHQVFLDEHDLPTGESYNRRIRDAIIAADLMIFFISPVSLERGRYTLTELEIAQRKWSFPAGRVLPVVLEPVDNRKIPAYLNAIKLCRPTGNLAAAVALEVAELAKRRQAPRNESEKDEPSHPHVRGLLAATGMGVLAAIVGVLTNDLAMGLKSLKLPFQVYALFHGSVLTLLVWLSAALFNVRGLISYGVIAVACIVPFMVEGIVSVNVTSQSIPLYMIKSVMFAALLAVALPRFRDGIRFAGLIACGIVAGFMVDEMARWLKLNRFIWEALAVWGVTLFLALDERLAPTGLTMQLASWRGTGKRGSGKQLRSRS